MKNANIQSVDQDNCFSVGRRLIKLKNIFRSLSPWLQLLFFLFIVFLFVFPLSWLTFRNKPDSFLQDQDLQIKQQINVTPAHDSLGPTQDDLSEIDKNVRPDIVPQAVLKLTANQDSYAVGEELEIILSLDTDHLPDGIEYLIFYEPDFLTDVSLEEINSIGTFISSELIMETGELHGVWLRNPEETQSANEILLLKLTAVVEKEGVVTFSFEPNQTRVAGLGGQSMLKQAQGLKIKIH